MLRAFLILALATSFACGDNYSLEEAAGPDAGLSSTPGDPPGDDVGDEPVGDDEPDDDSGLACTLDEITPILECAFENCLDLGGLGDLGNLDIGDLSDLEDLGDLGDLVDLGNLGEGFDLGELLTCTAVSCLPEILGVSSECSGCIFELVGGGENAVEACGGDLGGIPGLPGGGGGGGGGGGSGFPGLPF